MIGAGGMASLLEAEDLSWRLRHFRAAPRNTARSS